MSVGNICLQSHKVSEYACEGVFRAFLALVSYCLPSSQTFPLFLADSILSLFLFHERREKALIELGVRAILTDRDIISFFLFLIISRVTCPFDI